MFVVDFDDGFFGFQQSVVRMAEPVGHAPSQNITVTLLNIRNLVSAN